MKRRIVLALCLTGLLSSPAFAQTGQINGVVTDNTGGVVPGATVKARRSRDRIVERHRERRRRPLHVHVAAADDLRHHRGAAPGSGRRSARACCCRRTRT